MNSYETETHCLTNLFSHFTESFIMIGHILNAVIYLRLAHTYLMRVIHKQDTGVYNNVQGLKSTSLRCPPPRRGHSLALFVIPVIAEWPLTSL